MVNRGCCVAWEAVEINAGYGTEGFYFNATGLQWNSTLFGGWLGVYSIFVFQGVQDGQAGLLMVFCLDVACDWFHGVPQLFWKNAGYSVAIPASCANIHLVRVPI